MMKIYSSFSYAHFVLSTTGLAGLVCCFHCLIMTRRHIAKEKLLTLEDPSVMFHIPLPSKQVLSNKGIKYYYGFHIGMGLFIICLLLLIILFFEL